MIDFTAVQDSVRALKKQLETNQIDEKTFEDHLLALIDVAEDGHYWMYGHESERWFRHDGQKWVPANPDRMVVQRQNNPAPNSQAGKHSNDLEDISSLDWSWFIASIIIITGIGWLIYFSSLG
jgi:hypothetical protein